MLEAVVAILIFTSVADPTHHTMIRSAVKWLQNESSTANSRGLINSCKYDCALRELIIRLQNANSGASRSGRSGERRSVIDARLLLGKETGKRSSALLAQES